MASRRRARPSGERATGRPMASSSVGLTLLHRAATLHAPTKGSITTPSSVRTTSSRRARWSAGWSKDSGISPTGCRAGRATRTSRAPGRRECAAIGQSGASTEALPMQHPVVHELERRPPCPRVATPQRPSRRDGEGCHSAVLRRAGCREGRMVGRTRVCRPGSRVVRDADLAPPT